MPLQISPVPYRGDQYLFQGISSAGQGIAEGIEGMTKRLRQTKAMRTMAVDGMGMDPDKVDNMTPEQIQGIMQGMAVKNAQSEAQARVQMEKAHADYFQRFNQKQDAEGRFSDAVNQFMQPQPAAPMAPGDQGPPAPPTMPKLDPQTLMRLEAQAGTLDPDKAMQYMKQMGGGADADNPLIFDNTSVPNATVVKTKKGNEFQVLRNNDGTPPDAPTGYQMVGDGKGAWKAVKLNPADMTAGEKARLQMQHEKGIDDLAKSLPFASGDPEMMAILKGRMASHQTAINDLYGGKGAPATTPGTPQPMPANKADLQSGTLYQTGKGPATWDGTQFVAPQP